MLLVTLIISSQIFTVLGGFNEDCQELHRKLAAPSTPPATTVGKEFSHVAIIGRQIEDKTIWSCGGSLISKKFVLCSADCTLGSSDDIFVVRLGAVDLSEAEDKDKRVQDVVVVKRLVNASLALLELEKEIEVNNFVVPTCLWNKEEISGQPIAVRFDFQDDQSSTLHKIFVNPKPCTDSVDQICVESETKSLALGSLESRLTMNVGSAWNEFSAIHGYFGKNNSHAAKALSYIAWIESTVGESLGLDACLKKYSKYRKVLNAPEYYPAATVSAINEKKSNCTGFIIREDFVVLATECFGAFVPKKVFLNETYSVEIKEVHQNADLTLVHLKQNITYATKDGKFTVGPVCISPEKDLKSIKRLSLTGQLEGHSISLEQIFLDTTDCSELESKPHFEEQRVDCTGGSFYSPKTCNVHRYTGIQVSQRDGAVRVPNLIGFVTSTNGNCSKALVSRITDDDIEWINDTIAEKSFS